MSFCIILFNVYCTTNARQIDFRIYNVPSPPLPHTYTLNQILAPSTEIREF